MSSLNHRIRQFYDRSTQLWLDVWGEHMHHGYYHPESTEKVAHPQAQLDLVDKLLAFGSVKQAKRILDAGCGVGGSARLLAKRFGAQVKGFTLSPIQMEKACKYNEEAGLEKQVQIEVRDLMEHRESDGTYDLIWSLESAEHIAAKEAMFAHFFRQLEPGGKLVMATWCHRTLPPPLKAHETRLLSRIYQSYHLPPMCSIQELQEMAERVGFSQIKTDDWSNGVAPFWRAVIRSAWRWKSLKGLILAGREAIRGAWAMRYMTRGYKRGIIKFGVLTAQKP